MSVKAEMEKLFRRIGGDRESLVSECVDYLAYLSGSDGKITGDETGYIPAPQTISYVSEVFRDGVSGNARAVRSFFQAAVSRQADRLYGAAGLTDEELCSLTAEDVEGLIV